MKVYQKPNLDEQLHCFLLFFEYQFFPFLSCSSTSKNQIKFQSKKKKTEKESKKKK